MTKARIFSLLIIIASLALGFFVYSTEASPSEYAIEYGLDLSGGTQLIYRADVSEIPPSDVESALESLRTVIERRVNAFGVSEPLVQVAESFSGAKRLIVELPGVTDVEEAKEQIGKTPVLEFRLRNPQFDPTVVPPATTTPTSTAATTSTSTATSAATSSQLWIPTELTGRFLESAQLSFGGRGVTAEPLVVLNFNEEGAELFAEITGENVGEPLAIFLDGKLLSSPVVQQKITGGQAQITGNFTPQEARTLVRDLNLGALPIPIELVSTQTIGPSLGLAARNAGIMAGLIGILLVSVFLIVWYRLPGVLAVAALVVYFLIMLSLFKLVPVVITAAGIAGFILSIGMAVDANVLIFERLEEELDEHHRQQGGDLPAGEAGLSEVEMQPTIREAVSRAWPAIRDSVITGIISAVVLYWLGTSLLKGFAVTLGVGALVSLFTAVVVTRSFMLAVAGEHYSEAKRKLYHSGFGLKSYLRKRRAEAKDASS